MSGIPMSTVILAAAAVAGGLFLIFLLLKSLLYVGKPNEVLVFSGRTYTGPSGARRNYRALHGGLHLRIPGLEVLDRLDLTLQSVHIHIEGAYSKGGIPLNVHAIANVKVDSSDDEALENAIERFLGHGRDEIRRVAKETLEGNVRSVVADMTPEEVNENRQKLAKQLEEDEAGPDFRKLGLKLDTLKIQNIEDERDYLDSLGRKRIAEIIKVAEVAESNAMKSAEESEAKAKGQGEVARREAQAEIQRAQNQLREMEAELDEKAKSEEERADAKALEARARAEQKLQKVRTELEKIRLQADVVIPAEAEKVAQELRAQGEAAEIAEQGRAMAHVLTMMAEVWQEAGDDALDVFIMQRLEDVMDQVADAANQVSVREAAIIDGGDGESLPNYVSAFPKVVGGIFDEMRDTVGIDVRGAMTGDHGGELNGELGELRELLEAAAEDGLESDRARELLEQIDGSGNSDRSQPDA